MQKGKNRPSIRPPKYNDILFGTIGIAKPVPYDFTNDEMSLLMEIGKMIGKKLS